MIPTGTGEVPEVKPRHLKMIPVQSYFLLSLLIQGGAWRVKAGLPEDTQIFDIRADMMGAPGVIYVVVEHPSFPAVYPGQVLQVDSGGRLEKIDESHEATAPEAHPGRHRLADTPAASSGTGGAGPVRAGKGPRPVHGRKKLH